MKILDCTLRDGGYNNEWLFGRDNILFIVKNLVLSKVDIIELGYFDNSIQFDVNKTIFSSKLQVNAFTGEFPNVRFALMVDHRQEILEGIMNFFPKNIILRYAFHKADMYDALANINTLVAYGFEVYMQPMVSSNYSNEEFIKLIQNSNTIKPSGFYIVDSFGSFSTLEFKIAVDTLLSYIDKSIIIGFHAHDNRGLAAANAILFLSEMSNNELDYIVDSSINGMGRGAGNLKTEYLMDELNARGKNYNLTPLFEVIDNYFNIYHLKKSWGYSLNKHLSGRMNIHPNYAIFLEEIGLLTHIQVNKILTKIDSSKRSKYDEEYISKLYIEAIASNPNKHSIPNFKDKEVWIIAPGNENNIFEAKFDLNDNVILLSVNHQPEIFAPDYTFITKIKRYNKNYIQSKSELIITDDIEVVNSKYIVSRTSLMNDFDSVEDNAGLMAISLALIAGSSKISLIGFDGYKKDRRNVIDSLIDVTFSSKKIDRINKGMQNAIQSYSRLIKIDFLTPSLYNLNQRNTAK